MSAQILHSSGTTKGKRKAMEAKHFEMKKPSSGSVKLQRVERMGHQTENVSKRIREKLWQCQETVALMKIRSEMDASTCKGSTLWKDVSRKLAQQGYTRSAEKCKKKYANVCSYYKRIKQGHAGGQNKEYYGLFSCPEAFHNSTGGTTNTLAANTPNPSPVSTGIGMVGTSGRCQAFPSDGDTSAASPICATTSTFTATSIPNSDSTPVSIENMIAASSGRTQAPPLDGGTEAASPANSRPTPFLSENFKELVPASGGFQAEERFGREEAALGSEDLWLCQGTVALLKIRSEMDAAFCITTFKSPLWEVVSRKLAEQGYTMTPKTCEEKFEKIYNYYNTVRKIFCSQLDAPSPAAAITTTLAATSTPNPTPTPVSARSLSGRTQHPPSDSVIPAATTAATVTTHIKVSEINPLNTSGGSPIGVLGSAAANKDLKIVELDCKHLLQPTVEENRNPCLCLEKSNPPTSRGDLETLCSEDEAANSGLAIDQIDRTQSLSLIVEENQTRSICVEDSGDNQHMTNESITSENASMKSLKHHQSSNEVKSSFRLEAKGDERALQSAFDVTTNTNSFLLREDEGPLSLIDISLPFIKKSHMWRKFESMEVFQMMPQLPHFHALEKENEELREGLVLGHMLSFASLKDKTCKAHIEDSRSMFENKLNALTDLEELGFTVHLIRSRLEELLRIRDRYDQLNDKYKAAEGEILNEKCQFDEIEESITRLNMQLQELLMQKERKGFNIGELQRTVESIKEKLQNARLDFDNLVAASW